MDLGIRATEDERKDFDSAEEPSSSSRAYDERARKFWSIYVKESEQHDKYRTETWKTAMDSTLIFAGLFSAVVTAFLIDSYKLLQPDSSDETRDLLKQILVIQMVGASLNTSAIQLPTTVVTPAFKQSAWAVAVNILWFLSLSCSLATALIVTLVQQWIRDYLQQIEQTSQPQRRAMLRGIMFLGSEKWKMSKIVEYIPSLLHHSLFLFFIGLCIFLWNIDKAVASVVIGLVICWLAFYAFATIAPLFDSRAPYKTPGSHVLSHMRRFMSTSRNKANSLSRLMGLSSSLSSTQLWNKDRQAMHKEMQAVSWVYDRTTDDHELQDLVESIPGLLSSEDGRAAWKVFLSNSSQSAQELEYRTVRLLKSCASTGHLDPKSRQLRATFCIDSLLMFSSFFDSFKQNTLSSSFEFGEYILGSWDDDGTLATKAACAEAIFRRRSLILHIPKLKSRSDFRDLANRADQALRDIDDLRQILEDLKNDRTTAYLWNTEKDYMSLVKAYLDVVKPMVSEVENCVEEIQNMLPSKFHLLSWYSSLTRSNLRAKYRGVSAEPMDINLGTLPYRILGFLRFHETYPATRYRKEIYLSDVRLLQFFNYSPPSWKSCSAPAPPFGKHITQSYVLRQTSNSKHDLPSFILQELNPLLSLLLPLSEVHTNISPSKIDYSPDYCACHLMSFITPSRPIPAIRNNSHSHH